jgi:hypothetical protein
MEGDNAVKTRRYIGGGGMVPFQKGPRRPARIRHPASIHGRDRLGETESAAVEPGREIGDPLHQLRRVVVFERCFLDALQHGVTHAEGRLRTAGKLVRLRMKAELAQYLGERLLHSASHIEEPVGWLVV